METACVEKLLKQEWKVSAKKLLGQEEMVDVEKLLEQEEKVDVEKQQCVDLQILVGFCFLLFLFHAIQEVFL